MLLASPARKRADEGGMLLSAAFVEANSMDFVDTSMPMEFLNSGDRVTVNRPLPEYASMRFVIFGASSGWSLGRMLSRMYWVKLGRMESVSYTHLTLPTKRIV